MKEQNKSYPIRHLKLSLYPKSGILLRNNDSQYQAILQNNNALVVMEFKKKRTRNEFKDPVNVGNDHYCVLCRCRDNTRFIPSIPSYSAGGIENSARSGVLEDAEIISNWVLAASRELDAVWEPQN